MSDIKKAADTFYRWWPDHGLQRLADALHDEADQIICYASTMREHRPNYAAYLLRTAARVLEAQHYADIEHEHLGCPVAKTGIYAE